MKNLLLPVLLFVACSGAMSQTNSISYVKNENYSENNYEAKKIEKKNFVKHYSSNEKGTVVITSNRSFDVQLYIFDLENTIMYQGILKKKTKTKITSLEKGTYTYIIFANEESIEEGKLIIK
jgi:hypothetical protein